ncbi:PAS domain S-box protein [Schlegelella sp. ID0723]|uniref:histidine kinase n=2 Tax=Piscinibacter koreensis TaxID=2742824 RepID=A0A7Y6NKX7_9BURK|nr:PAS domain S-box protein [Schlegelella koreensis]
MVESASDYAIMLLDPSGVVLSWNDGARRMKGFELEEVIGQHVSMFYPSELLERDAPAIELATAAREGRFADEGWRVRKDGSRFWANVVITRLLLPNGQLRGFSKITRDISERRRQDELLRLSEERFRLLVEGVKDYAIFMLDPAGYIVSWNTGAQQTKGYEASEIIGQHFSVFYPPEVAARGWPQEELEIAVREGRMEDEGWRVRKDGSRFWASVVITKLVDANGRHRGFGKVTRDLTERRRVAALEDEGRRITTFLAMLGHELRNPLAPISNGLALLERNRATSDALRPTLQMMGRQLTQLTRLVDDLLDVGRITSGKIHLESEPVQLREVVVQGLESVQPLVAARQHAIEVDVGSADPWVLGDRARLVQVLSNLLHNAAKFTPSGGRIQIRLAQHGDRAELSVRDNGPGIAESHLAKVFELFGQGDQDIARPHGGLGLGLSLVRRIVVLHGGEVSLFSRGIPGEGAEFVVRLPTIQAPLPDTARTDEPDDAQRVLVVDDNLDAAASMSALVEVLGYPTLTVHDGPSAVEAIKTNRLGVVILDIGLPGFSGIEVVRRVRVEMAHAPTFIAVSGYAEQSGFETPLESVFHAHMTKPVDIERLADLLKSLLGVPRLTLAS